MKLNKKRAAESLCFSSSVLQEKGMLLHLSTGCNMRCACCAREDDRQGTVSLNRTGSALMTAEDAFGLLERRMSGAEPPTHAELGGLGEPLLDAGTYVLIRRLHAAYPDLPVTVWTNGILLPDRLQELIGSGLSGVVVTINAVSQDTADRLYNGAIYRCRPSDGRDASHLILRQQWNGLSNAVAAGVETTICTTRIRGVNDHEISRIETKARSLGADRIVIVALDE